MVKAVFFIKRGQLERIIEVKRADEPELFSFLESIADSVKALACPHKVVFFFARC